MYDINSILQQPFNIDELWGHPIKMNPSIHSLGTCIPEMFEFEFELEYPNSVIQISWILLQKRSSFYRYIQLGSQQAPTRFSMIYAPLHLCTYIDTVAMKIK